ncbi:beta strand repeat-containing protein [Leptolyngbya sp. PCC 6406]|uniref:beta strand repeat-containing protein n=1 Tax=Leptolyngbya sp. PCC 6406 TaxID=1173264 RepID=UPI0012DCF7B0|nr:S-layer family protein [Leptolyngbya sp. PCC 6406]
MAQTITGDVSIGTQVTPGPNYVITGGQLQGATTLLHSFTDFSLLNGTDTAHFDLGNVSYGGTADNVNLVIGRVTGGNLSTINGQITLTGGVSPDLFLINPSGFVFGAGASLNVPGSFVASTAENVLFANNVAFGIGNTPDPLLTITAPTGLQLGASAGTVEVQGPFANNFFTRTPTLSISPNQTLALIGGQVNINSANISAPDGHVELWGIQNGIVDIANMGSWQLSSSTPSPIWGTVTLRQSSYIDTSGATGGLINIRGRGLTLQDGSGIGVFTGANAQGRGINVQTTEFVNLLGASHPDNYIPAGLFTSVSGSGATAGNITIDTPQLRLNNGAWIQSLNYGVSFPTFAPINNARTGNITVRATDVEISGFTPFPNPATGVYTSGAITTLVTGGQQNHSGAITVTADRIRILDGGRISTDVLGSIDFFTGLPSITTGNAGAISVTATQSLEVRGANPSNFTSAVISSIQPLAAGQAGNVVITTGQLSLSSGGTISSAISGSSTPANAGTGMAGNVTINATDVQVSDPVVDLFSQSVSGITVSLGQNATGQGGNITLNANSLRVFNGGQITSSTEGNGAAGNVNLTVGTIDVQGVSSSLVNGQYLPSTITASSTTNAPAGAVTVTTGALSVRNGAQVTVTNSGTGTAGNLNVTGGTIFLDQGGRLTASTAGGNGGNMSLQGSGLILRHGSVISATAGGAGNGGNITINAPVIAGFENSDIIANAFQGNGGNIQITTQGIFGLVFRPQLTPENDITASSQFGLSGTVTIETPGLDPSSGTIELPSDLTDASDQVAAECGAVRDNSFVATGRGGTPPTPANATSSPIWADLRDLSDFIDQPATTSPKLAAPHPDTPITEAVGWIINAEGQVELVAVSDDGSRGTDYATCAANPHT